MLHRCAGLESKQVEDGLSLGHIFTFLPIAIKNVIKMPDSAAVIFIHYCDKITEDLNLLEKENTESIQMALDNHRKAQELLVSIYYNKNNFIMTPLSWPMDSTFLNCLAKQAIN